MNPLNTNRWWNKLPNKLHTAGHHSIDTAWIIFSKILLIKFLFLTVLSSSFAVAEPNDVDYAIPPSFDIPGASLEFNEPLGILALTDALSLALLHNPELISFAWQIRASEVQTLRAGLRLNPNFDVEIEDFAGSGDRNSFNQAQTTLALSQLIELGGKRMKRRALASTQRDLVAWDYETKRLDVLANVTAAFIEVLADQTRSVFSEPSKH